MKRAITILTAVSLVIGILAGMYAYDQGLAKAGDVQVIRTEIKLLHARFTQDQKIRRSQDIQQRLWQLEDRYEGKPMPQSVREEHRSLQVELDTLRGTK